MIELEVKFGPKTGLETVQNGEHAVVEVAPYDGSIQSPLVRVSLLSSYSQGIALYITVTISLWNNLLFLTEL